jgi:hypothetical protein
MGSGIAHPAGEANACGPERQQAPGSGRGSRRGSARLLLLWAVALTICPLAAGALNVPGVIIDHSPAASGIYIGSPSLAMLSKTDYIASHDEFGPRSSEQTRAVTQVFASRDRGQTWTNIARVDGQFWSTLFTHRGALYLIGTDRHHGHAIIRRSTDGGFTWTAPKDAKSGLLRPQAEFHCAPVPVLEHDGRLWRAFEHREPPAGWGVTYRAVMFSAPANADLLDAANWTLSNFLPGDTNWLNGNFGGWLEGNAVVTTEGKVADLLRVDAPELPERAALVTISRDGRTAAFDPATGFVELPGGAKKFTVRFDPAGELYWSLAAIVPPAFAKAGPPATIRNTLALIHSMDLVGGWKVHSILLQHPDTARHGFQYVDWQFDGSDIIAVCRTAGDDAQGGAHNFHDANYLTFHRIADFRQRD